MNDRPTTAREATRAARRRNPAAFTFCGVQLAPTMAHECADHAEADAPLELRFRSCGEVIEETLPACESCRDALADMAVERIPEATPSDWHEVAVWEDPEDFTLVGWLDEDAELQPLPEPEVSKADRDPF